MLKQRLITAAILIPPAVWAILVLPNGYFAGVLAALVMLAAWEWTALMGLSATPVRGAYVALMLLALWGVYQLPLLPVLLAALVWWLIAILCVIRFPGGATFWTTPPIAALIGILLLTPPWRALVDTHASIALGPSFVLFLMALIWAGDGAAYFAGRRWGRTKLAPRISPGKTWEGVGGALVAVVLLAVAGSLALAPDRLYGFIALCVATLLFSIFGDLLESMFKRHSGIKDSGTLLPGHGGMLDRIDSLTAASPIFVLGLVVLGMAP